MLDNPAHKSPTAYKLVCLLPNEKVLGIHLVGEGSDEMLQGYVSNESSLEAVPARPKPDTYAFQSDSFAPS